MKSDIQVASYQQDWSKVISPLATQRFEDGNVLMMGSSKLTKD